MYFSLGKLDPWISEFVELIELSENLFNGTLESGSRIAIVLLDNCVEFMYKAYLRIVKQVVGTGKSKPIKPNDWESEISRRFDKLIDAMKTHSILPHDIIDESYHYHQIRNELYHTGTPMKVFDKIFKEHRKIVLKILQILFNHSYKTPKERITINPKEETKFNLERSSLEDDYQSRIQIAQENTKYLWRKEKGKWIITDEWENPDRIMLSLLHSYPKCKTLDEIVSDTNLSRGYISNVINGRRAEYSEYFIKCEKGYQLSDEGIYFFIEMEIARDFFTGKNIQS